MRKPLLIITLLSCLLLAATTASAQSYTIFGGLGSGTLETNGNEAAKSGLALQVGVLSEITNRRRSRSVQSSNEIYRNRRSSERVLHSQDRVRPRFRSGGQMKYPLNQDLQLTGNVTYRSATFTKQTVQGITQTFPEPMEVSGLSFGAGLGYTF